MRQAALFAHIERTAPLSLAAPWDKSGLQVASLREEATHLAVCLDPLPEVVEEALARGADCILSHHPLALTPRLPDRMDAYHAVLRQLFRADVPLYAAHTSLDANPHGPVTWLARELKLAREEVLEVTGTYAFAGAAPACSEPESSVGFGFVGDLPAPLDLDGLLARLAPWVAGKSLRLAGTVRAPIRRLAVCPGSGADLAPLAASRGAELFITGDLKHHAALDAPLPILDVGHFALEDEMMRRFARTLAAELPALTTCYIPARDPLRPLYPTHQPAQENS